MNLLFVCSRNRWRSPTAEAVYKNRNGISARSAGTEPSARISITAGHIAWADIIFCMEQEHKKRITENFSEATTGKNIIVMDIPDEYKYMDEELIAMIEDMVEGYL